MTGVGTSHQYNNLIGRQPILDRNLAVFAYELMYRSTPNQKSNSLDGDEETIDILLNTFPKAGLNSLVGKHKAFINMTRNTVLGEFPIPILPKQVVLEIKEEIDLDYELIIGIKELIAKGYEFSVSNLVSLEKWAIPIGPLARYVKVDVRAFHRDELALLLRELKKKPLKIIAEKVETRELFNLCLELGFDYFQGYFFCLPEIIETNELESSRIVIMKVLSDLQKPNVELKELEKTISMDVTLVLSLLKLVNSGYYSLPVTITSISQAISLIGVNQLRNWLSFFLMAKVRNKPYILCEQALLRAKAAENFAKALGVKATDQYFLAGLFTILDTLMDMPMKKILADLNLSPEVSSAILEGKGQIGKVLTAIQGFEKSNYFKIRKLGISTWKLSRLYIDAIDWTESLMEDFSRMNKKR